jgi:phage FluMu protein Com
MADELLKVAAGVNFSVEVRCPNCQNLNKYQGLSSVHSNVKNHLRKAEKDRPADWSVDGKCESCDRWFKIVKTLWM